MSKYRYQNIIQNKTLCILRFTVQK